MDLWDTDALNLVKLASLELKGQEGEMHFIAVTAWLDIRYDARAGKPTAEFSWEGVDKRRTAIRPAAVSRSEPPGGSSDTVISK